LLTVVSLRLCAVFFCTLWQSFVIALFPVFPVRETFYISLLLSMAFVQQRRLFTKFVC